MKSIFERKVDILLGLMIIMGIVMIFWHPIIKPLLKPFIDPIEQFINDPFGLEKLADHIIDIN